MQATRPYPLLPCGASCAKRKGNGNQEKVSIELDTQGCLKHAQYNLLVRLIMTNMKTNKNIKPHYPAISAWWLCSGQHHTLLMMSGDRPLEGQVN